MQVADLPGALPALLGLVSGWDGGVTGCSAALPEARARAEVAAAAARCIAQLSVHERLRLRLANAGALPVLAAVALRAGGDGDALPGTLAKPSDPAPGASAAAGGGEAEKTPRQRTLRAPKPSPPDRVLAAAAAALQRGAAAALANLCGDAALAERAGGEGVVRALAALAASPDRDVQASKTFKHPVPCPVSLSWRPGEATRLHALLAELPARAKAITVRTGTKGLHS